MNQAPLRQAHVLIVDDDVELAAMLAELLARENWSTAVAHTAAAGEQALAQRPPDVVLLDVMLPDGNGLKLCGLWRSRHAALGIVMLTARGEPMDRVLGLEIGADDYLAKPFEPRELVARVRALLRRQLPERVDALPLRFNGLVIDPIRREVHAGGRAVLLTGMEFKLLVALAQSAGTLLSREALSRAVQAGQYKPQDRTVDVQIARLRRKLAEAAGGVEWIDTVRGEGYIFVPRA